MNSTELQALADSLSEGLIALTSFETMTTFEHVAVLGTKHRVGVGTMRTEWEMYVESGSHPALMNLILNWPYEDHGLVLDAGGDPLRSIDRVNTTNGTVIVDIRFTLTLRGQLFTP